MVKFQETNPEPGSGIVEWTQPNMNWNPWINQPMIIEGAEDYQVSDTQSCPSLVSLSGHAMDYRCLTTNQIKANSLLPNYCSHHLLVAVSFLPFSLFSFVVFAHVPSVSHKPTLREIKEIASVHKKCILEWSCGLSKEDILSFHLYMNWKGY